MCPDDHRDRRSTRRVGVVVPEGVLSPGDRPPATPAGGPDAAWPRRHRLRPSVEVFAPAASSDVYLLRPGDRPDLVIRSPDEADRAVLAVLGGDGATGPQLVDELCRRDLDVGAEAVAGKLAALVRAGVVLVEETGAGGATAAPLPAADAERFDRQLPYFAETGDPAAAQRRLRDATVVILGCGGLGTWALGALACAGVGSFVLVDDDSVDLSNLNRQILYTAADVGEPKAQRAADWVRRFDPSVAVRVAGRRVRSPADLAPLLDGAGALVLAADWPPYELARWVDAACIETGVPYISAGQIPPVLKIGPTYVPGRSACFACHERMLRREFPLYEELTRSRAAHAAPATTLGPASGVVGTVLAMEVMHLLVGDTPVATEGRALLLDMRTLLTRWESIERDRNCPSCHHLRT